MTSLISRIHHRATRLVVAIAIIVTALALAPSSLASPPAKSSSDAAGRASTVITRLGAAPAQRTVALELPLRTHSAALARFAAAVSTPGSARYGDYESVAVASRRFGASRAERTQVVDDLRRAGATDVSIDPTGFYADATMRVGQAQRLFDTHVARYRAQLATGTTERYLAPADSVVVPTQLRDDVTGVVGLNTQPLDPDAEPAHAGDREVAAVRRLHAEARSGDASTATPVTTSAYPSRTGTAAGCPAALAQPGFAPNQYLTAYGYSPLQALGIEGQGERVALIEIDGYNASDITAFDQCFGLSTPPISSYGVGIKHKLSAQGETDLDLELLSAAAPKLKAINVYESGDDAADVLRSLTAALAAKGRTPDVISASLGACEQTTLEDITSAGIKAVESILQLAAASGVSTLASSGDDGSTACVNGTGNPLNLLAVNFPASSPWVTGVGGTNIKLQADNTILDPPTDQIVWNDEPDYVGAGGGGVSMFKRPSYQNKIITSRYREVPDVSMLADPLPGYEIYCTAALCKKLPGYPWVSFGGTSAGTPLLAGGLALIDQQLHSRGQANIGFANPLLYQTSQTPTASSTLADVVSGSNDISATVFGRSLGCCTATTGYDQASGLGSVNIASLADVAEASVPKQTTIAIGVPPQDKPVATDHFQVKVTCSRECLMGAYAKIQIGARSRTAYSKSYVLIKTKSKSVRIGLSGPLRLRMADALQKGEKVTATLYGAIVLPSGQISSRTPGKQITVTR
jgi:subtilase family serine protease